MTLELSFRRTVKSTINTSEKASSSGTEKAKANSKYKPGTGKLGWPCNGTVIKKFSKSHNGIDIKVPAGTQIHASEDGTVIKVGTDKKLGKNVIIKHSNGLKTKYACCSSISVKKGRKVKKGDVIAKAGSTGSEAQKAQCHFSVQKNGAWKDPAKYVK